MGCKTEQKKGVDISGKLPFLETGSLDAMPAIWIDKVTKHRIRKLTNRIGTNRSFYFHNNPFLKSKDGNTDLMIFYGGNGNAKHLYTVNLETQETEQITNKPGNKYGEILGVQTRKVYYTINDSIFATHIDTKKNEFIYKFPDSVRGSVVTLNASENLLAGTIISKKEDDLLRKTLDGNGNFDKIYEAKSERTLVTINIETKQMQPIYKERAWLNHLQFSPTNPDLLMYCHEGPWHKVDRIWNINIKTKEKQLIHKRTVDREIAGHEFFSPDGNTIWFDLQIPRGETFYVAGKHLDTVDETQYGLKRDEWSIHYNISPDLKTFAGDGGDESQVAHAKDGKWLYHFTPTKDSLVSEKLVNMAHHDYNLEPNVHFSPDGKWVIFRANFESNTQIYAVELKKSNI
ncbi:oligogalacturonate lyase family protein [Formosa haliotis]|uniref:oligogalacturonate lyase family protein n=1 Tax=Formosa haliotis TaxID=1555194 RepID=UPI0008254277|nr:oligogalacturonate lyase family protein [Formosa haliotis]